MMRQYHKHMSLAHQCMEIYDKQNLHDLGELEQDMATGFAENGEKVNMKNIKASLVQMCQNPKIGVVEKLRLLMIYIIAQGPMQEATRKELMSGISLRLQKAIRNLEKLGVDISVLNQNKAKHSKVRLEEFQKRNKTIPMALMRYIPFVHNVLNGLVTGQLDRGEYPYLGEGPSATETKANEKASKKAATKSNWRSKEKKGEAKQEEMASSEDSRTRFIAFVLGGLTFSEMRSVYEIAEQTNSNLFIGSSSPVTAADFVRGLADLEDKEDLARANDDDAPAPKPKKVDDDDDDRPASSDKKEKKDNKKEKKDNEEEVIIVIINFFRLGCRGVIIIRSC